MQEVESYPQQDVQGYGLWVLGILVLLAVFGFVIVLALQGAF